MTLRLTPVAPDDAAHLVDFLASNAFPFHVVTQHTRESARTSVASGRFHREDSRGFWIDDDAGRHGVVVLEDPEDDTAMMDLRLAEASRGRGLGARTLRALADLVFGTLPPRRLEGQTREDNVAMRRTFVRAGYVQESYYRQGWSADGGRSVASVGYALLRDDWSRGTVTPLPAGEPHRGPEPHAG